MPSPLTKTILLVLLAAAARGQGGAPASKPANNGQNNAPASQPGNNGGQEAKFCRQQIPILHQIYDWVRAHKGQKPDLPSPPPTIPDCTECGKEGHHTPNQDKIDAYIAKVGQPEIGYVQQLAGIAHEMAQVFGDPPSTAQVPTDMGYCALYLDQQKIQDNIRWLMDRVLLEKVIPSVDKYQGVKEDIPALQQMVPFYCHAYASIIGYSEGNVGGVAGSSSLNDVRYENLQRADQREIELFKTYYDYFIRQLYEKYQYSLYPNLMQIARSYLLAGFHDNKLENDVYGYINQGIAFMHFKLKIEFEETGPSYHYRLKGEKIVRCKILPDTANTCYSFESEDGKGFPLKIGDVSLEFPNVTASYTGPKEVENPFIIRMNLCEGSPVFHLVFTGFGLKGTMLLHTPAGDVTSITPFHPEGYFIPDLSTAQEKQEKQEKLADDFKANMDKYKSAMMDWAAHRSDPNYASTPQGKKDMALIMQFQHQTGVQTPFLNAVQKKTTPAAALPSANNTPAATLPTSNNKLLTFDMPLHYAKQAIDYEHDADIGNNKVHYHAHVTLEETSDDRDNLKLNK